MKEFLFAILAFHPQRESLTHPPDVSRLAYLILLCRFIGFQ
jgi:hypothetical protein